MRFWLGLSGCLALAGAGAALTMEGNPPAAEPVPAAARPQTSPAWTDVSEADRAGVPRQMQARIILARQAGDVPRPAGDSARPPEKPAEPARAAADIRAVEEVRQRAEARVRQAEAETDSARRRLEQEEARANALSDAAMAARRDLIAARAEVEELRTRAAEPDGPTIHSQTAADEARLAAEKTAEAGRQTLAEERARSEQLAGALAEARRRVAVLETAAEAAQVAHQAQAQQAARERAMMRAGLRRLAAALRAAQVAQSEAAAQAADARDRAEQGRLAAERAVAETRGRLDRLKAGLDRTAEGRPATTQRPSPVVQSRPSPAPRGETAWTEPQTLDEERLLTQAATLLGRGDISGARLFLTLGVRSGSARATALLAETYDPDRLAALQVRGLRGDPETASALYRQAQQKQDRRNRDLATGDPGEAPPAGLAHGGAAGWTSPVRQAGLPGPFVPSLAAPWGGE